MRTNFIKINKLVLGLCLLPAFSAWADVELSCTNFEDLTKPKTPYENGLETPLPIDSNYKNQLGYPSEPMEMAQFHPCDKDLMCVEYLKMVPQMDLDWQSTRIKFNKSGQVVQIEPINLNIADKDPLGQAFKERARVKIAELREALDLAKTIEASYRKTSKEELVTTSNEYMMAYTKKIIRQRNSIAATEKILKSLQAYQDKKKDFNLDIYKEVFSYHSEAKDFDSLPEKDQYPLNKLRVLGKNSNMRKFKATEIRSMVYDLNQKAKLPVYNPALKDDPANIALSPSTEGMGILSRVTNAARKAFGCFKDIEVEEKGTAPAAIHSGIRH